MRDISALLCCSSGRADPPGLPSPPLAECCWCLLGLTGSKIALTLISHHQPEMLHRRSLLTWAERFGPVRLLAPPVEPTRKAAGRNSARRTLPRHLHGHSQQVHLLPGDVQHVVLPSQRAAVTVGPPLPPECGVPKGPCVCTLTHVDAGVIGENAVAGESHVFLLPLFVERAAAALQQDALVEARRGRG